MKTDAFLIIKGRHLVALWFIAFFYLPGVDYIIYQLLEPTDEWYWFDLVYYYYYHVIIACGVLILLYLGKPNLHAMFSKFQRNELVPSFKLTAFIFVFSIAAIYILYYPLSFVWPEFVQYWYLDTPPFIFYSETETYPIIPNLLSFFSMVLLAPFIEELIFRGLLLHRWHQKWGLKKAIIVSSLLFGLLHPDPIGATAFGIAMCIIYLRTQSLWAPILCHALNNLAVWLIEAGYQAYWGPSEYYTVEDFQNEWLWGLISITVVVIWLNTYLGKPRSYRAWNLPNAG